MDNSQRRVIAIIAAAGKGTRLGADLPKAYVELGGKSLLERSIQAMQNAGVIDEIVVVIDHAMEDYARQILKNISEQAEVPIRLVHGSIERADSVWCGVQAITDHQAVVLVHDAARALTPPSMIARVVRAVLAGAPAVIPVLPVADTIKVVTDELVETTLDRASLRAVQTPQGFDLVQLKAANEAYFGHQNPSFVATDDASLMEWHNVPVTCVSGDPMAFKVTTPLDYALAKALVNDPNFKA